MPGWSAPGSPPTSPAPADESFAVPEPASASVEQVAREAAGAKVNDLFEQGTRESDGRKGTLHLWRVSAHLDHAAREGLDQDILRLEIAMDEVERVDVCERGEALVSNRTDAGQCKVWRPV